MGLTLIEAAKYENRLEHLAVLKTFSEGELLARLPFMNIAGSGLFYSAEQELASVGFRAVNEGYTQSYGVVNCQEGLKLERTRSKHHRARPSQGRASAKVRSRQERSDLSQARLIEVMYRMHHHTKKP